MRTRPTGSIQNHNNHNNIVSSACSVLRRLIICGDHRKCLRSQRTRVREFHPNFLCRNDFSFLFWQTNWMKLKRNDLEWMPLDIVTYYDRATFDRITECFRFGFGSIDSFLAEVCRSRWNELVCPCALEFVIRCTHNWHDSRNKRAKLRRDASVWYAHISHKW